MMEVFEKIANWSMPYKLVPYEWFHLIFFVGGTALAIFLAHVLKTTNQQKIKNVFAICSIFLIGTEIIKQGVMTVYNGGEYNWYYFPFQLCSVPLYLTALVGILKFKHSKYLFMFMQTYSFIGGFFALLTPYDLLSERLFLSLHSMIWHNVLMFLGFYVCSCGLGIKTKTDFLNTVTLFVGLTVLAVILNVVVKYATGQTSAFFMLGPYICTMPILKEIQAATHWTFAFLVYVGVFTGLAFLLQWVQRIIYSRGKKTKMFEYIELDAPTEPIESVVESTAENAQIE